MVRDRIALFSAVGRPLPAAATLLGFLLLLSPAMRGATLPYGTTFPGIQSPVNIGQALELRPKQVRLIFGAGPLAGNMTNYLRGWPSQLSSIDAWYAQGVSIAATISLWSLSQEPLPAYGSAAWQECLSLFTRFLELEGSRISVIHLDNEPQWDGVDADFAATGGNDNYFRLYNEFIGRAQALRASNPALYKFRIGSPAFFGIDQWLKGTLTGSSTNKMLAVFNYSLTNAAIEVLDYHAHNNSTANCELAFAWLWTNCNKPIRINEWSQARAGNPAATLNAAFKAAYGITLNKVSDYITNCWSNRVSQAQWYDFIESTGFYSSNYLDRFFALATQYGFEGACYSGEQYWNTLFDLTSLVANKTAVTNAATGYFAPNWDFYGAYLDVMNRFEASNYRVNAPLVSGAPADFTTNKAFAFTLTATSNYGFVSTNGPGSFKRFPLSTNLTISNTTTLYFYGWVKGATGPTNFYTYTVDRQAPVLTGLLPSMSTNEFFSLNLGVDEDGGFVSMDGGATYQAFGTGGTNLAVSNDMTIRVFTRDRWSNTSATNARTYAFANPIIYAVTPSLTTNSPFAATFRVNQNYGWWSTNGGAAFTRVPAGLTALDISNTCTLLLYGESNGHCSPTNAFTYIIDRTPPVISGAPPGFKTNLAFPMGLSLSDGIGYVSTNGLVWRAFTIAGTNISVVPPCTLAYYAVDAVGNVGPTNVRQYAFGYLALSEAQGSVNRLRLTERLVRFSGKIDFFNAGTVRMRVEQAVSNSGAWQALAGTDWSNVPGPDGKRPWEWVWTVPADFDIFLPRDWRVVAQGDVFTNASRMPGIDLGVFFRPGSNLGKAAAVGSPFKGLTPGIALVNLPAGTLVRVYSASGELLASLTAGSDGQALWDCRSGRGKDAPSGVYTAEAVNGYERRLLRLVVVRP